MKKKGHPILKDENVIIFPGMVENYIENGLKFAEENNFVQAVACLDEANKYKELSDMVQSVYILSLLETGRAKDAKKICETLYEKKSPFFEQVIELYLTILLDLKEYKQLNEVLNGLMKDSTYTFQQKKNFKQLKELSIKLLTDTTYSTDEDMQTNFDTDLFELSNFKTLPYGRQEQLLQEAFQTDIKDITREIITIIESSDIIPTIKSLALLLLGAAGVNNEVTVEKFGFKETVIPTAPPERTAVDRVEPIKRFIENALEKDPTKLQMTLEMVHRHAYTLFPFDWVGYTNEKVANRYIEYVDVLFGNSELQSDEFFKLLIVLEESLEVLSCE
ncbi:hypothetical protein [Psychrobacillus psychrodurans]|uniref:hypothetical protein n=1 Tax=Psychrobacillus psychrodurans TaxID=126157 RepID=UPI0008EE6A10|nr:hypothetical protein [Psychrobacillus psychrodurans]MCZ8542043.1 hypothetical protein [Psychrobacillus psychrodurans]SFM99960.1 hypothetical protein SAMN05421832_1115 [Psychrobacillus psychrodurans]